MKAAFYLAFEELGGWPQMVKWAKMDTKNEGEFYKMASKLIPTEVSGPDGGPIETQQSLAPDDKAILERFMKGK